MKKYHDWKDEMQSMMNENLFKELRYFFYEQFTYQDLLKKIEYGFFYEFPYHSIKQFKEFKIDGELFEYNMKEIFKKKFPKKALEEYRQLKKTGHRTMSTERLEAKINQLNRYIEMQIDYIIRELIDQSVKMNTFESEKLLFQETAIGASEQKNIFDSFQAFPNQLFLSPVSSRVAQVEKWEAVLAIWFPKVISRLILEYFELNGENLLRHYDEFIRLWLTKYKRKYRQIREDDREPIFPNYFHILEALPNNQIPGSFVTLKRYRLNKYYDLTVSYKLLTHNLVIERDTDNLTLDTCLQDSKKYLDKQEFACAQSLVGDSLVMAGSHVMLYTHRNVLNYTPVAKILATPVISHIPSLVSPIIIELPHSIFRVYVEKSQAEALLAIQSPDPIPFFSVMTEVEVSARQAQALCFAIYMLKKDRELDLLDDLDEKNPKHFIKMLDILEIKNSIVSMPNSSSYRISINLIGEIELASVLKMALEAMSKAEKQSSGNLFIRRIREQYLFISERPQQGIISFFSSPKKLNKKIKAARKLILCCLFDLSDEHHRHRLENYIEAIKADKSIYGGRFKVMLDDVLSAIQQKLLITPVKPSLTS